MQVSAQPKIIFLHIHKTAGMTLRGLFVKNYRNESHYNTGMLTIINEEWECFCRRFSALPEEEILKHRVFKGRMRFGLHEMIPAPCQYITFLRDPLKRALSYYRIYRTDRGLPESHRIDPTQADWNLAQYPELISVWDNGQTRILSGMDFNAPMGACTREHLRQAKENLDKYFLFAGLSEKFDVSIMLMQWACGWKWHFYVPDNIAPKTDIYFPPELEKAVRELNCFDYELYAYVEDKLDELVEQAGWWFRVKYNLFIVGNQVHQALFVWRRWLKSFFGSEQRNRHRMKPSSALHNAASEPLAAEATPENQIPRL